MVPPLATQKNERAIEYSRGLTNISLVCAVPELAAARNRARRLAQKFNTWVPPNGFSAEQVTETKVGMINELFGNTFYANFNGFFSTGVSLITATHETSLQSRRGNIEYAEPITIRVTIGNGCTIGAGSVVTKSILEYSVAVGIPARVIKKVEPIE
ncbi:hypothetical protein FOXB_17773 [Fusarium oxysporum f. sp. conglutinans Fo5176]|uniref:Maltose/galactoside acetyltransferase domain-containing protein n=1 Tax=Fusarium oxysporum (strain Fo5176) TaxID=660025 RepID=F9GGI9_FUSOF|nr:hypothetical protein FOXB_17773 [Fusarium oxysporum f. sp. conglutinans Fo5176]